MLKENCAQKISERNDILPAANSGTLLLSKGSWAGVNPDLEQESTDPLPIRLTQPVSSSGYQFCELRQGHALALPEVGEHLLASQPDNLEQRSRSRAGWSTQPDTHRRTPLLQDVLRPGASRRRQTVASD